MCVYIMRDDGYGHKNQLQVIVLKSHLMHEMISEQMT